MHNERARARVEARDVSEIEGFGRSGVGVDDENVRPLRRRARIEFRRRRGWRSGGGRERGCGCADICVLVECEQLSIRDDIDLGRVQPRQLWNCCQRNARHRRQIRYWLTSVPRRMGLFKNTQAAKCVRCSWIVRSPFPISIMSLFFCQYVPHNCDRTESYRHVVVRVKVDRIEVLDVCSDDARNVVPCRAGIVRHTPRVALCRSVVSDKGDEQVWEETYDAASPVPHVCLTPDTETEVERSAGLV